MERTGEKPADNSTHPHPHEGYNEDDNNCALCIYNACVLYHRLIHPSLHQDSLRLAGTGRSVVALPPFELSCRFPCGYPTCELPLLSLTSIWLPMRDLEMLCEHLVELGASMVGEPVRPVASARLHIVHIVLARCCCCCIRCCWCGSTFYGKTLWSFSE